MCVFRSVSLFLFVCLRGAGLLEQRSRPHRQTKRQSRAPPLPTCTCTPYDAEAVNTSFEVGSDVVLPQSICYAPPWLTMIEDDDDCRRLLASHARRIEAQPRHASLLPALAGAPRWPRSRALRSPRPLAGSGPLGAQSLTRDSNATRRPRSRRAPAGSLGVSCNRGQMARCVHAITAGGRRGTTSHPPPSCSTSPSAAEALTSVCTGRLPLHSASG